MAAKSAIILVLALLCWFLAGLELVVNRWHPARTLAQPVPVRAQSTSTFWSGFIATAQAPYTGVQARWTIPSVGCASRRMSTAYVWIGEGGYLRGLLSPLIQAGTASDCLNGRPHYHAFFERYPGGFAQDFPMDLAAGDTVSVLVTETQPDFWLLTVRDQTRGSSGSTTAQLAADTGSADFVVERPTVCQAWTCDQVPLARFKSVTFQNIQVSAAQGKLAPGVRGLIALALTGDESQRVLAVPADPGNNQGLSVIWKQAR